MKANNYRGKLIVFEGLDGSGQTTQAGMLKEWFTEKNQQQAYYTKEPTEGPIGLFLRLALANRLITSYNGKKEPIDNYTMALAFAADRMDHLNNEIIPKLKEGVYVIMDRYYLSSFAYQSLTVDHKWLIKINEFATRPDLTIFLDVPPAICKKRMEQQRWHVELYEELPKLEKVFENYRKNIRELRMLGETIEVVDANVPTKDVHKTIVNIIKTFLLKQMKKSKDPIEEIEKQQEIFRKADPFTLQEIAARQIG